MPKIVDHDERRAHIVEAVTQIIIRDGFDRVTMREIAAEAGFVHGAITRYFPDKRSLLIAAFLRVFEDSHRRTLESVEGFRGLEALARMTEVLLPFSSGRTHNARVVLCFWDRAAQDPELYEIHRENFARRQELIRTLLRQAREDGEIAPDFDIEHGVDWVCAHNAGWQMMAVLVPESTPDVRLRASIDAMIAELRHTS
ncbi:MAG: TetR/AcrR family transcriptional regulator [Candidatus Leucobacter sulfamidivorax]|nr:TetR/AcrR family transcriptional regulator [Candidatus Leucobacter sulfamidivorax]